jgi:4-amino-4-deoxy-L-arabinose transferase-like glycosyltransferase
VRELELRAGDSLHVAVGLIGTALSLACLLFSVRKKDIQAARVGLLLAGMAILCLWQLAMLDFYHVPPTAPLALGLLIILAWALDYRPRADEDVFGRLPGPASEFALIAAALAVTVAARALFLDLQPYGLEGDEMKWTVEVARSMVDGEFIDAAEYHLSSQPVSFYMQALFVRTFGTGILNARLATVTYSILASAAFYALARRLSGPRVAWLATFLLGISLFDVSASRLANVESMVKLWPIGGLLALAWALDTRRTGGFIAAGVLVGLGLLAYDTVAPLLVIGFILLFYELHRLKVPRSEAVRYAAAYAAPQLLVLPVAATYWAGRLQYYELGNKGLQSELLQTLGLNARDLWHALFSYVERDFLYNRQGPLFESPLSPWLLAGVLLAIVLWRRGRMLWALVVGAFFFLPVPIVADAAMGRVLYPGLPAAYFLMAVAGVAVYGELRRLMGSSAVPALLALAAVALAHLTVHNLYISFNEIDDPDDRRIRRELYDMAAQIQGAAALGVFPYLPAADDAIQSEEAYAVWLGMRSRVAQPADIVTPIFPSASSMLPALSALAAPPSGVVVVWDTSQTDRREERDVLLETFARCYPSAERNRGEFFDSYTLDAKALANPACLSAQASAELAQGSPTSDGRVVINWHAVGATPRQVNLVCGTQSPAQQYLQAELMTGSGWVVENRFAVGYDGEGFLADPGWSDAPKASLEVELPSPDDYYVWVRSYRRIEDPYGAVLSVNGHTQSFATSYTGQEEWIWERLGPFRIETPTMTVAISRPYGGPLDRFIALFFDALVVTSNEGFAPERDDPYQVVLDQTTPNASRSLEGTVSATLPQGIYACTITLRDGERLVSPWGDPGVEADPVRFEIANGPS